ncbi:DnaB-like helicase C terminal domain protein [Salmonella phage vB_SentM_sal1]|nr:DnaB-like helicase C terminal domain protein [Salmonella phage vB_SentM_sal1]
MIHPWRENSVLLGLSLIALFGQVCSLTVKSNQQLMVISVTWQTLSVSRRSLTLSWHFMPQTNWRLLRKPEHQS